MLGSKATSGQRNLPRYACCWSGVIPAGRTVGIPGMKVFSLSVPAHLDFFLRFRSGLEPSWELLASSGKVKGKF